MENEKLYVILCDTAVWLRIVVSILVAVVIVRATFVLRPKEIACYNGDTRFTSKEYIKNDKIVVLKHLNGDIQAFKPSECK